MAERPLDAPALALQERMCGGGFVGAGLHLDRRQNAAAPRDEIDLALGNAIAPGENAIPPKTQMPEA